jgi:PTH1 family peptidyl-tRNA hydrolase
MKIIAGLGNPGPKYETTRHNAGFLAVDRLVDRWRATGPMVKNQGEVFETSVGGEKVLLIKPLTYMNLSGRAVAPLFNFYKCTPADLIVIHDELDLDPMVFRLKTGGSAGGHNGLKSIDESLGSGQNGYHRVRIGIGHPSKLQLRIATVDWVLQHYSQNELNQLDPVLDDVADAVELIVKGQITQAMNKFNRREPPKASG